MDRLERAASLSHKGIRSLLFANVALMCLLLLGVGVTEWATGKQATVEAPKATVSEKASEKNPFSAAAVASATTGKAIFRTNATTRLKTVDELSHYQLQGFSVRDGQATAYLRDTKLKKTLMKRVGDTIGPYEITGITEQGVTVKRGAEEALLSKG